MHLVLGRRKYDLSAGPLIMGILNVTPDSFSDGGDHFAPERALTHARDMIAEGADIVDIGPESTRPGARPISPKEQIARAVPTIEALREASDVAISIDTSSARVAIAALDAGADLVNDVSALRDDPAMVDVVASRGAGVVLMHMRGKPADMQRADGPHYDDVLGEITTFLRERRNFAVTNGIEPSGIILDPGIGFGKRVAHNLDILRSFTRFVELGQPILVGASRKSFIGRTLGIEEPKDRDAASVACAVMATLAGATVIRAHAVKNTLEAVRMCVAVANTNPDATSAGRV